jgi:hypothetical protein
MKYNPTRNEISASWKDKRNTALARAIHGDMTHCSYDRYDAHRWALKLIAGNPANGEEAMVTLVNFDWMDEGARAAYRTKPAIRKQYDNVFTKFTAWKAAAPSSV